MLPFDCGVALTGLVEEGGVLIGLGFEGMAFDIFEAVVAIVGAMDSVAVCSVVPPACRRGEGGRPTDGVRTSVFGPPPATRGLRNMLAPPSQLRHSVFEHDVR